MGAYAPLPWLPDEVKASIVADVVEPVAAEMVRRGCPFSGLLYAGLAITSNGPAVVEFNCRFGDPETQAVLALLESPLGGLLKATATGSLGEFGELRWRDGYAVTVVVAAENYLGRPRVGDVIVGATPTGFCMPERPVATTVRLSRLAGACCRLLVPVPISPPLALTLTERFRRFACRVATFEAISPSRPPRAGSASDAQAVEAGRSRSVRPEAANSRIRRRVHQGNPPAGGVGSCATNCVVAE